jgi:hypothetical protein
MTAKEKAIDIYNKFYGIPLYIKTVKECCRITINEIIRVAPWGGDEEIDLEDGSKEFYINVKKEIEKL